MKFVLIKIDINKYFAGTEQRNEFECCARRFAGFAGNSNR